MNTMMMMMMRNSKCNMNVNVNMTMDVDVDVDGNGIGTNTNTNTEAASKTKAKAKVRVVSYSKKKSFLTNLTAATLLVIIASTMNMNMNMNMNINVGSQSRNRSTIFVDARRSGGGSSSSSGRGGRGGRVPGGAAGRRSSGSGSSGSRGSGRSKNVASSKRRRSYYDDEEDEEEDTNIHNTENGVEEEEPEMNFGFLDDDMDDGDNKYDDYDDNVEEDEDEDEDEPIAPVSRSRGGRSGRSSNSGSASASASGRGGRTPPPSSRRSKYEQEYDDEYDEEDDYYPPPNRRSSSGRGGRGRSSKPKPNSRRSGGGGRGTGRGTGRGGTVVPYGRGRHAQPQQPRSTATAFTRGLAALRESIPDPNAFKDTAFHSLTAARETTSKLTSNIYREVKGLTSSELEQVMLKATSPNDVPVKGKHVERLVGVTYQISGRYDIYDAVLRKLWSKMVEKDWRTTVKALYILHRFSADGAPDHQAALKARLRELRRTRDPKRGKEKYFNSKQLLSGDTSPANIPFRAFLSRYAHYVLLRAQCFGGMFTEIANDPNKSKQPQSPSSKLQQNTRSSRQKQHQQQQQQQNTRAAAAPAKKCITSTCLKNEHLEAAQMLLKAGLACELKSNGEEECENTAIALERVVSDLIGLTTTVATALNNALRGEYDNDGDMDWELVAKWCGFYSEKLLVQTKSMMKRTTPILDAYGLFLPSRMGVNVSQDLLQKGLKGRSSSSASLSSASSGDVEDEAAVESSAGAGNREDEEALDREEENDVTVQEKGEGEGGESGIDEERVGGKANMVDEDDGIDEDDGYDEYDEYEYEEYDEYE